MRHGKKINHLSRKAGHRKAMMANMACSLIEHKRINTTVAKAKALKKYVEPLITKSKTDSTHSRRTVFSYLQNKYAVSELFRGVAPKVGDRPGGYTRIIRTGTRLGDNAEMCLIELVDFNELYGTSTSAPKKAKRSRRGGAKKKTEAAPAAEAASAEEAAPAIEDAVVVEEAPAKEEPKAEEAKAEAPVEEAPAEEAPAAEAQAEAPEAKEEAKDEEKKEDDESTKEG